MNGNNNNNNSSNQTNGNIGIGNITSNGPKKIIRNLALKRIKEVINIDNKVKLDRVLGFTISGNVALDCDPSSNCIVYPAGCVLVVYNIRRNKQIHTINTCKKPITATKFSNDGKYIVTGECGHQPHVRVWDASTCEQVAAFAGHKFGINCVAFSPNNKYVVSVGSQHDMIVNVWDWKNNLKIASNKISCKVKALSFSSNGQYFVTVGNRHVKFWYLEYSKSPRNKFESLPLMGRSAILGDQRNNYFCDVACGRGQMSDSTYSITKSGLLCEFNNRRLLDKWVELRTTSANCISISDELICVGCAQGIVRCFDPKNLHFICTLPRPHTLGIDIARGFTRNDLSSGSSANSNAKYADTIAVALDQTNQVVTCVYGDRSIYFWTISNIKKIGKLHSFLYHSSCIWAIETYPNVSNGAKQLLPSGTFLTCSSDDTIRIWNLNVIKGSQESNYVYKRNIFSPELLKILYMDPEMSYICDIDVNPNDSNEKSDTTYDGKNGVRSLKLSPDARHLASGDRSGNIRIFDLDLQQDLCKIEAHDSEVLCLEYSDEHNFGGKSLLASASRDRLIHIFDVRQQYSFVQTMDDHSSSITAVKFVCNREQKNLQMISCGADKSVIFRKGVDINGQSFNFVREHHIVGKTTLYDMEVDVEQCYALTACQDRMIRVYDVKSGKNTTNFKGSQGDDGTLIKIALDPSGQFVATSCTDKSLYIYDYQSGDCLAATSGHSELVTGLKFSQDGKNLISVSGDGCIFIWKLPNDMVNAIAAKLGLPAVPYVMESPKLELSAKPLLIQNNETNNDEKTNGDNNSSALYRFNLKSLPLWAKKQMFEELSRDPNATQTGGDLDRNAKPAVPAKGRWAQRMENSQNLVVKSYLTEDTVIPYPNVKQQQNTVIDGDSGKYLNNKLKSDKNNGDHRYRATDSSSASSFPHDEDDDFNTTDSDNTGYSNDKLTSSVFKVNESPDTRFRKNNTFNNRFPRTGGVMPSISVPNFNELHSDDEDDSNTTVDDSERSAISKNSFYMSTENLDRIDQRDKYLKSAFENLDQLNDNNQVSEKSRNNSDSSTTNRASLSAKYHSKTSPISPKMSPNNNTNESSNNHSTNNRVINNNKTPLSSKPPISKRREELTKAISEARKKLQTLGWKGSGLSNSKSVANLRDYSDYESDNAKDVNGDDASEAIRRSISLSDLSFGPKHKRLSASQLNLNANNSSAAPLWEKNKNGDSNASDTVSRSTSISTLNKSDSNKSFTMKNKGLWGNGAPAKPPLSGRVSAPPTQARKAIDSYSSGRPDSSEDEMSSSSDEKRYPRPSTPPKPNILKQIRRSSTSHTIPQLKEPSLQSHTRSRKLWNSEMRSSKSEYNLSNIGRETPIRLRNKSISGNGLWGSSTALPQIQNEKLDLAMTNPSTVPLTQELCQLVVNELGSISRYAIRILERSSESGNTNMRQFLSDNISTICHTLQSSTATTATSQPQQQPSHSIPSIRLNNETTIVSPTIANNANNIPYNSLPPESMTHAMTLLQQYSDKLLNLVEQKFTKKE
ncbi:mitogen-activated protein kinase-binding protein 1-like [Oppia nitens]|uniref:mitogen-activated protein kinase-binding protein 1-like n=1 Tax=Oppia nitens TaxID=1686743 RepID=UPI0023DACB90|nr:mitogen-activated protein kinase-binding protein 1-like [Oppia nitens]